MTADRAATGTGDAVVDVAGERVSGPVVASRAAGAGDEVHPPAAMSSVTATTWTIGRERAGAVTGARYQVGSEDPAQPPTCRSGRPGGRIGA